MQINLIETRGSLSLFEVSLEDSKEDGVEEGNDTKYRMWETDEKHAKRRALVIAESVSLFSKTLIKKE
jgi:hypothetical protein